MHNLIQHPTSNMMHNDEKGQVQDLQKKLQNIDQMLDILLQQPGPP